VDQPRASLHNASKEGGLSFGAQRGCRFSGGGKESWAGVRILRELNPRVGLRSTCFGRKRAAVEKNLVSVEAKDTLATNRRASPKQKRKRTEWGAADAGKIRICGNREGRDRRETLAIDEAMDLAKRSRGNQGIQRTTSKIRGDRAATVVTEWEVSFWASKGLRD